MEKLEKPKYILYTPNRVAMYHTDRFYLLLLLGITVAGALGVILIVFGVLHAVLFVRLGVARFRELIDGNKLITDFIGVNVRCLLFCFLALNFCFLALKINHTNNKDIFCQKLLCM